MTVLSQPGIINVLDYGMVAGDATVAQQNAQFLQNAINDAQKGAQGAIVLIPSFSVTATSDPQYGPYYLDTSLLGAPITIPSSGSGTPLLILGTGSGTTLITLTPNSVLFQINSSSFVAFQDLEVIDGSAETTDNSGIAFYYPQPESGIQSEGYNLFRLIITNFPVAVKIGNQVEGTNVLQCNISYDQHYSNVKCTAIYDSGAQTNIEQCSLTFNTGSTPSGMIGVQMVQCSYPRLTDTQISGFNHGIELDGSGGIVLGASLSGLQVDAVGSCVTMSKAVYDACFVNCTFQPTDISSPPDAPAISVSSASAHDTNPDFDTIRFTACNVVAYGEYGLAIYAGQNIQVNGGSYSGNGNAGIAILGAAAEIQITGANCIGTSYAASPPATQQYGIYVSAGSDIQIVGANCSGNGVAGIEIVGTPGATIANVQIIGAICNVLGGASQQYGISASFAAGLIFDGCALTGNTVGAIGLTSVQNATVTACDVYSAASGAVGVIVGASPLYPTQGVFVRACNGASFGKGFFIQVPSTGASNVAVTDCAGYNDQAEIVKQSTTSPLGPFSALTYGYYGPVAFYLASTSSFTAVTIDGQTTSLTNGGFTLSPGETAQIASGPIEQFLMVGK